MLFDNDNTFMNYDFMELANLTNDMIDTKNINTELVSVKDGFLKGNMFKNEYKPYKDLTFLNIIPKNEREAKLLNVMQYEFAVNDLNLYLDIHPEDKNMLNILEKMIEELNEAKEEYINNYGSLNVCDTNGEKFDWIDSPWPFDGNGGSMYV